MSVVVKDMNVPDKCIDCRFFAGRWCYVIPNPEEQSDRLPLNGKPEWCPLSDGRENVHGRWKTDGCAANGHDDIYCSNCGEEAPEWISVEERLPEEKELVLCYTPVDGYMFVGYHFSYKWGSDTVSKWRIITSMRSTKDITKKVTHWMPLPEPPKEDEP